MKIYVGFGLLICCALISWKDANATERKVPDDYPSGIQAAVNASSSGDTVSVTNSSDFSPVTISKALLLRQINNQTPSITASTSLPAIRVTANNVTVRGFTVKGIYAGEVAARVSAGLSGTTFEDCLIRTNGTGTNFGIVGTENVTARRCTFHTCRWYSRHRHRWITMWFKERQSHRGYLHFRRLWDRFQLCGWGSP